VNLSTALCLGVAALGGAAIGLERQWSGHASGPAARFGGIRTFTLLGTVGGIAGWLSTHQLVALAAVVLAGAVALVVAGYVAASRVDVDATTEVAAIVVLTAGTLAGAGEIVLASGIVATTVLLLVEKTRLHDMATRLDDASLRASARFAVLSCVILPLLPVGPFGPLDAIRPRELWLLVLFFSGISFLGWVARRHVGPQRGVIVSGLLGGVISSTSVTLTFARESRGADAPRVALAAGVIGACTVMLVRVTLACAVLNPALALRLPLYVGPAFALGAAAVLLAWRLDSPRQGADASSQSPLQLRAALQMTGLFQAVLFLIIAVQSRWGEGALVATAVFVGLTDLDALTLSVARSADALVSPGTATMALVAGMLSNTVLKFAVAVAVGKGWFRAAAAVGLGAIAVALGAAIWLS